MALSLGAILPVIYGLKEMARSGWQRLPVLAIVVGVAFAVLFVRRQHRLAGPLLDLRLFANRAFSAALGSMLFGTMLMGAIMLLITQYLQLVALLSPLQAGLWMLPSAGAATLSFITATMLVRRFRPALHHRRRPGGRGARPAADHAGPDGLGPGSSWRPASCASISARARC